MCDVKWCGIVILLAIFTRIPRTTFWKAKGCVASFTGLGDFWKSVVTNHLSKVAQMFGDFWGIFKTSLI